MTRLISQKADRMTNSNSLEHDQICWSNLGLHALSIEAALSSQITDDVNIGFTEEMFGHQVTLH